MLIKCRLFDTISGLVKNAACGLKFELCAERHRFRLLQKKDEKITAEANSPNPRTQIHFKYCVTQAATSDREGCAVMLRSMLRTLSGVGASIA